MHHISNPKYCLGIWTGKHEKFFFLSKMRWKTINFYTNFLAEDELIYIIKHVYHYKGMPSTATSEQTVCLHLPIQIMHCIDNQ